MVERGRSGPGVPEGQDPTTTPPVDRQVNVSMSACVAMAKAEQAAQAARGQRRRIESPVMKAVNWFGDLVGIPLPPVWWY